MVLENNIPTPPQPDLPPPGDERREVLAAREDQLQQQIDERSQETMSIDPSKMEPEREILDHLDKGYLTPPNADPNYRYVWIQCRHPVDHPSRMVELKLAEKVKVGDEWIRPWTVVKANEQDGQGLPHTAENTCVIGDVLLMRCRKDHYVLLEREKMKKTLDRQLGADSSLVEVCLNAGTSGGEATYNKYRDDANYNLYGNDFKMKLDHALRTGTLPGVVPGVHNDRR